MRKNILFKKRRKDRKGAGIPRIFPVLIVSGILLLGAFKYFSAWDGQARYTVVFQNIYSEEKSAESDLTILSLEPQLERGVVMYIAGNVLLDLPFGYKTYPASSVYRLGKLETSTAAGHLLKKSLELTLGIKLDSFLTAEKNWFTLAKEKEKLSEFKGSHFSFVRGLPFLFRLINGTYDTDLKLPEKIRLFSAGRKIRLDQLKFVKLASTTSVYRETLPDKQKVWHIDPVNFDHNNFADFEDSRVRKEDITVEVENATGEEKVATMFARVLRNYGVKVIARLTAGETESGECKILVHNAKAQESLIAAILEKDYLCQRKTSYNENSQADLKIVLGEKFIK